jgi:hypothetical protein
MQDGSASSNCQLRIKQITSNLHVYSKLKDITLYYGRRRMKKKSRH